MKLLVCCQLFYPELLSTGLSMTELCESLRDQGVEITVICGQPTLTQHQAKIPAQIQHHGITIKRLKSTQFPKLLFWGKLLNHLSYAFAVLMYLLKDKEKTPILVLTNPPMMPFLVAIATWIKRRPFAVKIADVYPDTAVVCGVLPAWHPLVWLWRRCNQLVYRRADALIVLGRCMSTLISAQLAPKYRSKLQHIHVWCDDRVIGSDLAGKPSFKQQQGFSQKLVIGYSGNMGRFHEMQVFLDAAEQLKDQDNLQFCFVGGGHRYEEVARTIKDKQLHNCAIYPYVDRDDLNALLQGFDIGLVSLKPGQEGLSVPSKTYGLLACGMPVLALMSEKGEIAQMIQESGCGVVCQNVNDVVTAIKALAADSAKRKQMGEIGKQLIQDRYALAHAATAYKQLFQRLSKPDSLTDK